MTNKLMQQIYLYLCLQLVICSLAMAQNEPTSPNIQFGKVERAELAMTVYPKDSAAIAVVLYDKGTAYYEGDYQGFRLIFERHLRIKLLSPAAYIWSRFEIPIYKNNNQGEELLSLEGYTHLLNDDGKIVRHKLEAQDCFKVPVNNSLSLTRFAMPFAAVGAVVEYKYKVTSDMIFNLPSWEFQRGIPTIWSEYEVKIPEYLSFNAYKLGDLRLDIEKIEKYQDYYGLQGTIYTADIYKNRYVMKDLPAFLPLPTWRYPQLLVNRMEFFLDNFKFPWMKATEKVPDDWATIYKELQKDDNLTTFLKKSGESKEMVRKMTDSLPTEEAKMQVLFDYVRNTMVYNGETSRLPSAKNANMIWAMKDKQGNTADINLWLVALLRQAKLKADYVVLATKETGHPQQAKIIFNKLNMVIAVVEIAGKQYLLDASSFESTLTQLPDRCRTGKGLVVADDWRTINLEN